MSDHPDAMSELIGPVPGTGEGFARRQRRHQGWWRAFVLGVPPGPHPRTAGELACNTVAQLDELNFLSPAAGSALDRTLEERKVRAKGILDESRARGNLLSSQPLAFNAFGELAADLDLAFMWLRTIVADVEFVTRVVFEYQPEAGDIGDESAFDVAFEYQSSAGPSLLAVEVKYTDAFSFKNKAGEIYGEVGHRSEPSYRAAYDASPSAFGAPYETLIGSPRTNQLFRSALIAECAKRNGQYASVSSALFCHPGDRSGRKAGAEFASLMGDHAFVVTTVEEMIATLQREELNEAQREWTMMLWARYLASALSRTSAKRRR